MSLTHTRNNFLNFASVKIVLLAVFLTLTVAGCNNENVQNIGVIDLDKIAQATGKDKLIIEGIKEFSQAAEIKLNTLRSDLIKEVEQVKAKLGKEPKQADQLALVKLAKQADLKLNQEISKVKGDAGRLKIKLVLDFKNQVQPIARQVAKKAGMTLIAVKSANFLFIDPKSDITDAVIDEMLKLQMDEVAKK